MLLSDALPVVLGEIRQGDKVAVKEAQAVIIVFQIERPAHTLWHLSQKAEWALVIAGSQPVEQRLDELDADCFVGIFFDLIDRLFFAAEHAQLDSLFGSGEA